MNVEKCGWIGSGRTFFYEVNRITLARCWKTATGYRIAVGLPDVYVEISDFPKFKDAKAAVEKAVAGWFAQVEM